MQRLCAILFLLTLPLLVLGCADEGPTAVSELAAPPAAEPGLSALGERGYPAFLLGRPLGQPLGCAEGGACAAESPRLASNGGFTSPLFGLATAPNGDLLVADAGAGVALQDGHTEIALPGVTDIGPLGRGTMWASTAGMDPTADTGQALYRVSKGKSRMIANLFAFEAANDPDGPLNPPEGNVDSNPFDLALLGGHEVGKQGAAVLVADAGGNDLLRVDNQGQVEVLAVFPNELVSTGDIKALVGCPAGPPFICELPGAIPAQAVPTSVAVGPDGHYYVGELKGFPAPLDESSIWRVAPDASWALCGTAPPSECEKVFDGGFTSIIDLVFGEDGTLYVLELDEKSWAQVEFLMAPSVEGGTVNACDVDTGLCAAVATGLPIPTALTFGKDGTLWSTIWALVPGLADVVPVP